METLKSILMDRDGCTAEEADIQISDAKDDLHARLAAGEIPYDICEEYFGLEPDYIMELM